MNSLCQRLDFLGQDQQGEHTFYSFRIKNPNDTWCTAHIRFHQLFDLNQKMRRVYKHFNGEFPRRSILVKFNKSIQETRRSKLVGFMQYIVSNEEYYHSEVFKSFLAELQTPDTQDNSNSNSSLLLSQIERSSPQHSILEQDTEILGAVQSICHSLLQKYSQQELSTLDFEVVSKTEYLQTHELLFEAKTKQNNLEETLRHKEQLYKEQVQQKDLRIQVLENELDMAKTKAKKEEEEEMEKEDLRRTIEEAEKKAKGQEDKMAELQREVKKLRKELQQSAFESQVQQLDHSKNIQAIKEHVQNQNNQLLSTLLFLYLQEAESLPMCFALFRHGLVPRRVSALGSLLLLLKHHISIKAQETSLSQEQALLFQDTLGRQHSLSRSVQGTADRLHQSLLEIQEEKNRMEAKLVGQVADLKADLQNVKELYHQESLSKGEQMGQLLAHQESVNQQNSALQKEVLQLEGQLKELQRELTRQEQKTAILQQKRVHRDSQDNLQFFSFEESLEKNVL